MSKGLSIRKLTAFSQNKICLLLILSFSAIVLACLLFTLSAPGDAKPRMANWSNEDLNIHNWFNGGLGPRTNYDTSPDMFNLVDENGTILSANYDESKVSENYGFGIYNSIDPQVGMNLTQFLKENESFMGYLEVENAMYKGNEYLLTFFVDYKQVPFYLEGKKAMTHLVEVGPMTDNFYAFRVDNISAGTHDVVAAAFLNPYEHSLDTDFRLDTDFAMMGRIRLNLVVGDGSYPFSKLKKPNIPCLDDDVLEGILLTKEPCSLMGWFTENVTRGQTLEYYVNVGNNEDDQRVFGLMQFMDYNQVPITYGSDDYVYYGYLEDGEKAAIPASVRIPNDAGVHELVVFWFLEPYENIEITPGVINMESDNRMEPSIRIGLNTV